jgi:flagellar hook-associated protein 1
MSTSTILSLGLGGMRASQAGTLLVSENVAGQSVEGFHRRRLESQTAAYLGQGPRSLGPGWTTEGFARDWSRMLEQQRYQAAGAERYREGMVQGLRVIDGEVADATLSLDAGFNRLFESIADLTRVPDDAAAAASVRLQAQSVASSIGQIDRRLQEVATAARENAAPRVEELNQRLRELSDINAAIRRVAESDGAPAALLDRRDALLMQVAEAVGGDVGVADDGQAHVYLGGSPLVQGSMVGHVVVDEQAGQLRLAVVYAGANGGPQFRSAVSSASIAGSIRAQLDLFAAPQALMATASASFRSLLAAVRQAASPDAAGDAVLQRLASLLPATTTGSAGPAASAITALAQAKGEAVRQVQTTTLDGWRNLVSALGTEVRTHRTGLDAAQAVGQRLELEWQSRSGVNLDEEAANLLRYQQAYSASSRVIQVYGQMIDQALALLR